MQSRNTSLDDTLPDVLPPAVRGEPTDRARRGALSHLAQWAAAGVVSGWIPVHTVAAQAQSTLSPPAGFPAKPALYRQAFRNWTGEIALDNVWTAAPATPDEVVAVANWAHANGWRVRPRGRMHNWSPLTLAAGQSTERVVLLDTTRHLTGCTVEKTGWPPRVTAQTGITMERLLALLSASQLGLSACPDVGDITLGGALAIGGHGTGVRPAGQPGVPGGGILDLPGDTFGSLSNRVTALTAVVHDASANRYVLRKFQRSDPDIAPLLAHLGRAFVIDVTLQVNPDERLLCETRDGITFNELFASPGSSGNTFANLVDRSGRLEVTWLPFTERPLVRTWVRRSYKPDGARLATGPYNYDGKGGPPAGLVALARRITSGGEAHLTPQFCAMLGQGIWRDIVANDSTRLWGPSRTVLQYVRPDILPLTGNGFAIVTRRSEIQRVVNDVRGLYNEFLTAYQVRGMYPMNGRVGIRVTGLDRPGDIGPNAVPPSLSAAKPRPDHPEWDVVVWVDMLTLPGTPRYAQFCREVEDRFLWFFGGAGRGTTMRPEWSKGWAYTQTSVWDSAWTMASALPPLFTEGQPESGTWQAALRTLDRLDPGRLFTSPLLERLMPKT